MRLEIILITIGAITVTLSFREYPCSSCNRWNYCLKKDLISRIDLKSCQKCCQKMNIDFALTPQQNDFVVDKIVSAELSSSSPFVTKNKRLPGALLEYSSNIQRDLPQLLRKLKINGPVTPAFISKHGHNDNEATNPLRGHHNSGIPYLI